MYTAILAIGLILLMAGAASVYVYAAGRRQRKTAANALRIAQSVKDYFARSGAEVSAQCLPLHGRFLVLVESEPLKRFRYSNIVETSLANHIEKALGLHIDRVFWRFPLPLGAATAQDTADLRTDKADDEYISQGVRAAKTKPDYHVAEDSWEQFEKARQKEAIGSEGG